VAYGPSDHNSAAPSAMTMSAARWCFVSRKATEPESLAMGYRPRSTRRTRLSVLPSTVIVTR